MTKSMDDAKSDLAGDFAALRDDVARLTSSVTELLRSQTATTGSTVRDAVGAAREKVAGHASYAQDQARGFADTARQVVSDHAAKTQDRFGEATADLESAIERNPLVAMLIALGAGMLVGAMSRGRS